MTPPLLHIDYAFAMAEPLGGRGGLAEAHLEAESTAVERAVRRVTEGAHIGRLGFWGLPHDKAVLGSIDAFVDGPARDTTDVLLLGIGGSSLGPRAVDQALGGPPGAPRARRLHFPDNSDPWLLDSLLGRLDPQRTLALVVSKSGGTVETAAQYLVVRAWLTEALGEEGARSRVALVTDPTEGPLRALANREGLTAFDVPPNVGGRFSVLSPVGLLPARLAGYDTEGLLSGAASMADLSARTDWRENPAAVLAALHVLHHRLLDHRIHVMMPYADALRPFAAWYVQLWAESLGKRLDRHGRCVERGPTPLPAVGATDQHAQMQLFMEGPRDKLVTFIAVEARDRDRTIPTIEGPFAYLGGTTLGGVLDAERRGTTLALAADGRPSITLVLPRLDAPSLGALLFLYEAATAISGELYGVDAFDQPGVELGKRLASGLLGRPGHEEAGQEVREREARRPVRFRVP